MNQRWMLTVVCIAMLTGLGMLFANQPSSSAVQLTGTTKLTESSGLAFSTGDPNCVWTHNDSGDSARLFCFDARTGKLTGQCSLAGAESVDWESLTTAGAKEHELIVADCGDNAARRDHITLYRFDEPDPHQRTRLNETQYQTLHVRFPGGPVDCEAVWYDANEASVILLAKGRLPIAAVFRVPDEMWDASGANSTTASDTEDNELKIGMAIRIATLGLPLATGADRDAASGDVWVASYFQAFCFRRGQHATLAAQLSAMPVAFEMPRLRQIEAIAVDKHANVWVTSEGLPTLLAPLAK